MTCKWKHNWGETQHHFRAWWAGRGLVLNLGDFPVERPSVQTPDPGEAVYRQSKEFIIYENTPGRIGNNPSRIVHPNRGPVRRDRCDAVY